MAWPLLTKGAIIVVASLALTSCESNDIHVVKIEDEHTTEPSHLTCKVNKTLQIILPQDYEDNINWSINISIVDQCKLRFEKLYLRTSRNGKCIDSITFTFPDRTYVTPCNGRKLQEKTLYINATERSMKITVQSGERSIFGFFWWTVREFLSSSKSSQFGFTLTLRGVSLSEKTGIPPIANASVDLEFNQSLDYGDISESNTDFQDCSLMNLSAKVNFSGKASINCNRDFLKTMKGNQSNFERILDNFKANESQCKVWCGIVVPFFTDGSVIYLNDTHALTTHEKNLFMLSCTPDSGTWSNLPSCQGFINITSTSAGRKEERQSVIWIGLGSAVSLLVVVIALIMIYLAVQRRFPSALHRCSLCCIDIRSKFTRKPDEQIAMENNPVYG